MSELKEIPQREWEDYVQIRDTLRFFDKMPFWNEATVVKDRELRDKLNQFHAKYDEECLEIRYQKSLSKNE